MAVPALLGIPAFISFIGSAFASAFTWIMERLTMRIVVFGAAMATVLAALNTLYSEFSSYIGQLALTMPTEMQSAAMILPSNTGTCMSLILSAHMAALAYRMTLYIVKTKMELVS